MSKSVNDIEQSVKNVKPLVFISHDTRDGELAEAFSNLLKSVSAGVLKSFRASDKKVSHGIEYGVEWYPEIIKNIQEASDVVCLLTENSVNRPWILFEAGMAKGKLNTPILGLSLGISLKSASIGPFAQFQNCGDDEDSLTKLVFQLVDRIPNSEPDEDTIKFQVGKFKTKVADILNNKTNENKIEKVNVDQDDSLVKLFEEIKVMFQDLPSRIQKNLNIKTITGPKIKLNSLGLEEFHPMMLEDLMMNSKSKKIGIIILLSFFRDSMPWVYEVGIETMRTIMSAKTKSEKKQAYIEFREFIEIALHHPLIERYFINSKEEYVFIRELPCMIERAFSRIIMSEK